MITLLGLFSLMDINVLLGRADLKELPEGHWKGMKVPPAVPQWLHTAPGAMAKKQNSAPAQGRLRMHCRPAGVLRLLREGPGRRAKALGCFAGLAADQRVFPMNSGGVWVGRWCFSSSPNMPPCWLCARGSCPTHPTVVMVLATRAFPWNQLQNGSKRERASPNMATEYKKVAEEVTIYFLFECCNRVK